MFFSKKTKAFIALAEELSYQKASDRLCISRTPLFRLISLLEDELQVSLFYRGKDLALTHQGSELYRQLAPHYYSLQSIINGIKINSPIRIFRRGPVADFCSFLENYIQTNLSKQAQIEEWAGGALHAKDVLVSFEEKIEGVVSFLTQCTALKAGVGIFFCGNEPVSVIQKRSLMVSSELLCSAQFKSIKDELNARGFGHNMMIKNDLIDRVTAVLNRQATGIGSVLLLAKIKKLGIPGLNFLPLNGLYFNYYIHTAKIDHNIGEMLSSIAMMIPETD